MVTMARPHPSKQNNDSELSLETIYRNQEYIRQRLAMHSLISKYENAGEYIEMCT